MGDEERRGGKVVHFVEQLEDDHVTVVVDHGESGGG